MTSPLSLSTTPLPNHFYLARIPKHILPSVTRPILQLSFFSDQPECLFSFSQINIEDEEAASFIIDSEALKLFPSDTVISGIWRAIQVNEGAAAIDETGDVSLFSKSLASEGINVVYVSTYSTDILLVEESDFEKANKNICALLQKIKKKEVTLSKVGEERSGVCGHSTQPSSLLLQTLPVSVRIASLTRPGVELAAHGLLKLFFFPHKPPNLFSFISVRDEITLLVEEEYLDLLELGELTINPHRWRPIVINVGEMGWTGIETVSWVSSVLAKNGVSIYYLSTFNTDLILVTEETLEKAVELLRQSGPSVTIETAKCP